MRIIGDNKKVIPWGSRAGSLVVVRDRFIIIPQKQLNPLLHVITEFPDAPFDLVGLRADTGIDKDLLVIREMHEPGKTFPEAHRIKK